MIPSVINIFSSMIIVVIARAYCKLDHSTVSLDIDNESPALETGQELDEGSSVIVILGQQLNDVKSLYMQSGFTKRMSKPYTI